MGRKRLIAPDFFKHSELYEAEMDTGLPLRLAFAGLWCQADRRGIFRWRSRELKLEVLPYDDHIDFEAVLSALEAGDFVRRYDAGGRAYGYIPTFTRWQTFHRNETPSLDPAPPDDLMGSADLPKRRPSGPWPSAERRPVRAATVAGALQDACKTLARPLQEPCKTLATEEATPVTVTSTVTSTVAVAVASTVVPADVVVREADRDHRVLLTAAANQGQTEQFGEQPVPLRWDQKGTHTAAAQLEAAAVPLEFARQQVYELARTRTPADGRPPRTLGYYAAAIIDAWRAEEAHRVSATVPLVPTDLGGARVLSWDAKIAREEEAARVA